ncbi:MAG: hypothetical protein FWE23_08090 [Chitinivibrionia bacterium]|nr:hypothetical protein [Chitinivibrionia bacterium]
MTLQRTVNITGKRQVHLDLPVPQDIPVGKTLIKITFVAAYSNPQTTKIKKTQPLKTLENAKVKKKSAFGCLNEYADVSKISLEKGAWEREVAQKYAVN